MSPAKAPLRERLAGPRGLVLWCAAEVVLAALVLVMRHGPSGKSDRAVALAALAAVLGVLATRGWVRRGVAACTALLGVVLVGSNVVAVACAGVALVILGVGAAMLAGSWPAMGRRYDAPGSASPVAEGDLWSRIDQGDDPTQEPTS